MLRYSQIWWIYDDFIESMTVFTDPNTQNTCGEFSVFVLHFIELYTLIRPYYQVCVHQKYGVRTFFSKPCANLYVVTALSVKNNHG